MTDIGLLALAQRDPEPPVKLSIQQVKKKQNRSEAKQSARLPMQHAIAAPETILHPEFSQAVSLKEDQAPADAAKLLTSPVTSFTAASTADSNQPEPMEQITSVSQLIDVRPADWAFQALQSLVERYGCIAGYPDRSFQGNRALTRYEFAAGLNACLDRVNELIQASSADLVKKDDLATLRKLQEEYAAELIALKGRVDALDARTITLEKTQFSTTTRLVGQAIFSAQGSNSIDVDLFPRDGVPERKGAANPTLGDKVELSLVTSFRGNDLLLTTLQTGNISSSIPNLFTNMGRLAYESELGNRLVLSDLSYRFPVSKAFGVIVGPTGVNAVNTFRGINPLEGYGDGALSLFGQRNPILSIGNGTGGIGFDWQITPRVSLQGVYSAELPNVTSGSFGVAQSANRTQSGLFGGRYTFGTQLSLAPTDKIDVGLHYLFSHSPDEFLGTGVGDSQLLSPFFPGASEFNTHAIGGTVAWRLSPGITLGGWGGWTTSSSLDLDGSVQTTNWMVFSAFPDLFARGNLGGILFGQPPKITASSLPTGYNFPKFAAGGDKGGQSDTAFHLEVFYRARMNQSIDLTPGVLVIFSPNHNSANDTLVIGSVRATFRF